MIRIVKDFVDGAPVRSLAIATTIGAAYDIQWGNDISGFIVLVLAGLTGVYAHKDEGH